MRSPLHIELVPTGARESLTVLLEQSFTGMYRWHAKRTLRSVRWVRRASIGGADVGLVMCTMLETGSGYIPYVAVSPSQRGQGIGGALLDDALHLLRSEAAREVFACVRPDNIPSIRLFGSRGFAVTGFRGLASSKGITRAARNFIRMVVAPGEKVFKKALSA